jgi:hypothetical protein
MLHTPSCLLFDGKYMKKTIVVSALISMLLAGCGGDKDQSSDKKAAAPILSFISVSDGFTITEKPAISIYFGKDDENYCNITVPKEVFESGASIKSQSRSNQSINGSCTWNNENYEVSAKHPTYVSLDVISATTEKAEINVSLKVIDTASLNEFLEFNAVPLQITTPDDIKKISN